MNILNFLLIIYAIVLGLIATAMLATIMLLPKINKEPEEDKEKNGGENNDQGNTHD